MSAVLASRCDSARFSCRGLSWGFSQLNGVFCLCCLGVRVLSLAVSTRSHTSGDRDSSCHTAASILSVSSLVAGNSSTACHDFVRTLCLLSAGG